jgi:la-related protein 1
MPSPVSPVSPMYYFGPPPPPEALRGMALAPMVGPPAYPYFQALHEPQPDAEADAEDNHAKLLKQIEFYFRWLLLESIAIRRKKRVPLHFY